uniref:Uncharacterized protein n=1 Tax=Anguilla anguilla TaxID=7936 RepID=A0A0E9XE95_ANGAN
MTRWNSPASPLQNRKPKRTAIHKESINKKFVKIPHVCLFNPCTNLCKSVHQLIIFV